MMHIMKTAMLFVMVMLLGVSLGKQAQADKTFDYNAKGLSLNRAVGRTLVGVTRDKSKTWSLYLARDKNAYFHFSSGRKATATWSQKSRNIICFKGLIKDKPYKEICKYAKPRGRGMDWQTVVNVRKENGSLVYSLATKKEHRGSSQIVYSLPGRKKVNQNSYISNVALWPGQVIVGRTLKDREAWFAALNMDRTVDFAFGSGKRYQGRYTVSKKKICFTFAQKPVLNGCRVPTLRKGKIRWVSSKDGRSISELVYMQPLPKIPQGFQLFTTITRKKSIKVVTAGGGNTIATLQDKPRRMAIWDAASGRSLFGLTSKIDDLALSPSGRYLAVASKVSIRVYNTADGSRPGIFLPRSDTRRVAVSDDGWVAGAALKGPLGVFRNGLKKTRIKSIAFDDDHIVALRFIKKGLLLVGMRSGKVYTVDVAQTAPPHLIDTLNGAIMGFGSSNAANLATAISFSGEIGLYKHLNGGFIKHAGLVGPEGYVMDVAMRSDGKEMIVASNKGVRLYRLPDLVQTELFEYSTDKLINQVGYSAPDGGLVFGSREKALKIYARDRAEYVMLDERRKQLKGALKKRRKAVETTLRKIKAEKEKRRQEQQRLYTSKKIAAEKLFNAGDCKAYEKAAATLKQGDRREDCLQIKIRRQHWADYRAALNGLDCDTANIYQVRYKIGTDKDVQKCRDTVVFKAEKQQFEQALQAGDCATVAKLEAKMGAKGAAADCRVEKAMQATSARKVYFAAIKFDASKDRERARKLYSFVMEAFPDDDLALDAAQRLLTLNDQEDAEKKQAQTAAALAEAKTAVETANRAKLAAEKRAEKEAARARKASAEKERARRKAAEARAREAEARAREARAKANANRRNTACDHVTLGQKFSIKGGGFFGIGDATYRVIGISRAGGIVTGRLLGTDIQNQFSCYRVR